MKNFLRLVSEFIKPYWVQVVIASLLMVLNSLLIIPIPLLTRTIIDKAIPQENFTLLLYIFLGFIGLYVIRGLLQFLLYYKSTKNTILYK